MSAIRLAIVTVSDGVARGEREDGSGQVIADWAHSHAHTLAARVLLADETAAIARTLCQLADEHGVDLILTTGGTGLTARDVTPEATRAVLEREAPGIAEAIRAAGAAHTPHAWLSRGVAGTRGQTLIINLPGSVAGVSDALAVLDQTISHAVQLVRGIDTQKH